MRERYEKLAQLLDMTQIRLQRALNAVCDACNMELNEIESDKDYALREFLDKLGLLFEDKYPFKPTWLRGNSHE